MTVLARDDWGWITRVPKILMLKEPKRRVRFLKEEEADRLMLALPEHLVPVVQFALATGCRFSAVWAKNPYIDDICQTP